ncbi:MAG: tetratricopeptide repeat protein [Ignavibacteriales bacterium]|nr:tetratricopeptide repeat protein [Ignavibacteriales bacterium]
MKYLQNTLTIVIALAFAHSLSAQDQMPAGRAAFQKKLYTEAVASFQAVVKSYSRNVEAWYLLGESYLAKGVYDSAQTALERTVDINDEYVQAYSPLFTVYGKRGLWDKATKRYAEAVKVDKKNTAFPMALGNAYLASDSVDKAVVYYSKAKEINENLTEAYVGLAEAYGRQNIQPMAVANFQKAAELNPTSSVFRYKLGKAYYKNRQFVEALKEYKETIRLDSTNADVIFEIADILYRSKPPYYRDAASYFKRYAALKSTPEAYEKYAKSLYLSKTRDYKEAVVVLEKAVQLNPAVYDLKPMLALELYLAEEYKKSLDLYKSIPKDSLGFDEYIRMGRSQLKLKDTTGAIASFEKANSLDSTSVEVSGELAAIFVAQRKFQKAAEQYERKLKVEPTNTSALYYGAFSYSMIDKFDEAKLLYKRFVDLRPAYPQGRMALARMYVAEDSADLGRKQYLQTKALIDSLMAADTSTVKKEDKYSQTLIDIYQALGAMDYGNKDFLSAVDNMEKAVSYESKEVKKKSAALF